MANRQFAAGEIIFHEGQPSEAAYFITSGTVQILKHAPHGDVLLATIESGKIFGEMGLFDSLPRSATARAVTDCDLMIVGHDELHQLITQCPEPLMSIIHNTFERLRNTNKRLSEREAAVVALPVNFTRILLYPDSEKTASYFQPMAINFSQLPFGIGGFPESEPRVHANDPSLLTIGCEGPPLVISKRHLGIEIQDNCIFLVDRGSRFGTIVNGRSIGRGKGIYKIPLQQGEFSIQFAGATSPYKIRMICE